MKIKIYIYIDTLFDFLKLKLNIIFGDRTVRFIESQITRSESAMKLADELVDYGLVSEVSFNFKLKIMIYILILI